MIKLQRLIGSAPQCSEVISNRAGSINHSCSPLLRHTCVLPPEHLMSFLATLTSLTMGQQLISISWCKPGTAAIWKWPHFSPQMHLHTAKGNMVISSLSPVKAPPQPSTGCNRKESAQWQKTKKHQKDFDLTIADTWLHNITLIYAFLFKAEESFWCGCFWIWKYLLFIIGHRHMKHCLSHEYSLSVSVVNE